MSHLANTENSAQPFSLTNEFDVPSFDEAFDTESLKRFYHTQDIKEPENKVQEVLDKAEHNNLSNPDLTSNQNGSSLSTHIHRFNDDNPAYKIEQELNSHVELESHLLKGNDLVETDPFMSDIINGMSNMTVNKEADTTQKDYHAEQKEQFMKDFQMSLGQGTAEDLENINVDKIHKQSQYIFPSNRELQRDQGAKHNRSFSVENKDVRPDIPAQRKSSVEDSGDIRTKDFDKQSELDPSVGKGVGRLVVDYFKAIYAKKAEAEA